MRLIVTDDTLSLLCMQLGGLEEPPPHALESPRQPGLSEAHQLAGETIGLSRQQRPVAKSDHPDRLQVFDGVSLRIYRERMRQKILGHGTDTLSDEEILGFFLSLISRKGDLEILAAALIGHFGSLAGVLSASSRDLLRTPGLGRNGVVAIRLMQDSAFRLLRAEASEQPVFTNWSRVMNYLQAVMAREPIEQLRILFLNNRNRLLADELQGRGTVNHTPVYPREVVRRALELNATGIILVHNHPSGDPAPSATDIEMTREVRRAAEALSIALHDHVIVGNGRWFSMRQEGVLEAIVIPREAGAEGLSMGRSTEAG